MSTSQRHVDAAALKGLAHPLRVELFDALIAAGSATASQLAEQLGESSGATSYHLRQLARHGYIEDDPAHAGGRERWWRPVPGGMTIAASDMAGDSASQRAAMQVARQFADQRARRVDEFLRHSEANGDSPWVDASMFSSAMVALTVEETSALSEHLADALSAFLEPLREREDPPNARRVATHINVFPVVGAGQEES
ncbi:ArsR/SmtB family transcription factor [Demequina globuliformis]|uniref:ArsR/SmtB family transcription factor n=1 Tax=Demequina globuliformis TaxID=676202 RepID=UPI0007845869|nr:helix-turn-helix domain-containing protein [Demequina globuliformis]